MFSIERCLKVSKPQLGLQARLWSLLVFIFMFIVGINLFYLCSRTIFEFVKLKSSTDKDLTRTQRMKLLARVRCGYDAEFKY